ncbi:MAG TPA: DEAD/DEAH box helicase, partial [Bacillota bacterium]|nr:DEAD/DEAH box helicase [Bacillota bacterium]
MTKYNFDNYGLSSKLLKAIDLLNYQVPSKVQGEVIPIALEGKDIVVKSQTGSGKTAAFAIPICQLVDWDENQPQALVVTPTRELAIQVREDIFNIGRFKRLKIAAVYGKAPFYHQERELKQKTHVVVGTPGRIIDHIEKGTLNISKIRYLVIDEADEMFNMGFIDQIESIIGAVPKNRTTMLFSATMPADVESLCYKNMRDPVFIDIESENLTVDRIGQERYAVNRPDKKKLLKDLTIVENPDSCIIFCNTRERVDEVYGQIK